MCVCVGGGVRACVRACVPARVCVCVPARVCVCAHVSLSVFAHMHPLCNEEGVGNGKTQSGMYFVFIWSLVIGIRFHSPRRFN